MLRSKDRHPETAQNSYPINVSAVQRIIFLLLINPFSLERFFTFHSSSIAIEESCPTRRSVALNYVKG